MLVEIAFGRSFCLLLFQAFAATIPSGNSERPLSRPELPKPLPTSDLRLHRRLDYTRRHSTLGYVSPGHYDAP
jgi:hypothetical protein